MRRPIKAMPYIRERYIVSTQADTDIICDIEDRKSSNTINNDSDTSLTIESNDKKIKDEEKSLINEEEAILKSTNNEIHKEKTIEFEKKESKLKSSLYSTELYSNSFKVQKFILYKDEVYQIKTLDKVEEKSNKNFKIKIQLHETNELKKKIVKSVENINVITDIITKEILIINYKAQSYEIRYPISLNKTLEDTMVEFAMIYKLNFASLVLILNGKRLEKKDLSNQIGSIYNSKMFSLVIMIKTPEFIKFEFSKKAIDQTIQTRNVYTSLKYKNIILPVETIIIDSLNFPFGFYYSFKVYEVSLDINNYLNKSKKADKNIKKNLANKYNCEKIIDEFEKHEKAGICKCILSLYDLNFKFDSNLHTNKNVGFMHPLSNNLILKKDLIYYVRVDFDYRSGQCYRTSELASNKASFYYEPANSVDVYDYLSINTSSPFLHVFTTKDLKYLCLQGFKMIFDSPLI